MNEDTGLVRASVAYPFAGAGSRTRLLVGAGLEFLGGVVLVGAAALAALQFDSLLLAPVVAAVGLLAYLPLLGYAAATMRALLDDEDAPPAFLGWGAILRDGRRVAVVAALYALPLVALGGAAFVLAGQRGGEAPATLAAVALAALYALAASYVLPAALVTVVDSGRTGAALRLGTLRTAVVDRRYLGRWVLGGVVGVGGTLLGAALSPMLVGFAVGFAAQVAAVYAVTRGVVLSLDLAHGDPPAPPASGYVPGWDDGPKRKELSQGRLGGSLLPTTPDDGEDDAGTGSPGAPTPGSLATTGDGDDGHTDLDRRGTGATAGDASPGSGSAAGASGAAGATEEAPGSDIQRFGDDGDETELAREDEE